MEREGFSPGKTDGTRAEGRKQQQQRNFEGGKQDFGPDSSGSEVASVLYLGEAFELLYRVSELE